MTDVAAEQVWKGADALRPFLVPIDSLEPFPGNPRRGDVELVRASLRRFGQVRPILVDGSRIVAGHHVRLGAVEDGWTHIAAIPNDFGSEAEARAYLLADNRIPEHGTFEDDLLLAQLREVESLEGTGYGDDDVARLDAELRDLYAEQPHDPPRLDEREPDPEAGFQVPIYLTSRDQRRDFARWVSILRKEWGEADTTAVVVRAVKQAALEANS